MSQFFTIALLSLASVGSVFGADKALKPIIPKFDKFKNTTTIGSWMVEVNTVHRGGTDDSAKGSNGRQYGLTEMSVGAVIHCPGDVDRCSPSLVTLDFHSYTKQWIFIEAHSVILLIDGDRESLGAGEWNGVVLGADSLDETIAVAIPTDVFVKIANAKTVEVQINGFEFPLKDKNFAALKQLVEHLDSVPSNPQKPLASPVSSAPEAAGNVQADRKAFLDTINAPGRKGHGEISGDSLTLTSAQCNRENFDLLLANPHMKQVFSSLKVKLFIYTNDIDLTFAYDLVKAQVVPQPTK